MRYKFRVQQLDAIQYNYHAVQQYCMNYHQTYSIHYLYSGARLQHLSMMIAIAFAGKCNYWHYIDRNVPLSYLVRISI